MHYLTLFLALTLAAQQRQVIVLPAGPDLDPTNRTATILDLDTWKPLGTPQVGIDAYQAFTLPDSTKTYVVARGDRKSVV